MTPQQPLATLPSALTGTRLPVYRCYPGPLIEGHLDNIHKAKKSNEALPRWRVIHAILAVEDTLTLLAQDLLGKGMADDQKNWINNAKSFYSRIIPSIEAGRVALPHTGDEPWDAFHLRANELHRDWLACAEDCRGRPSSRRIAVLWRARQLVVDVIDHTPIDRPHVRPIAEFDALYDQLTEAYAARHTTG